MISLGGSMCVKNVRRIVMSDVKCNQCGNKVYPKHHCNKCYATIDRDELKRLQSLEQAPSGLRVYTADEIWAGREYNPQAIPMDMEFIEKEKYICESVKQSPGSMIAEPVDEYEDKTIYRIEDSTGEYIGLITTDIEGVTGLVCKDRSEV